MLLKVLVLCLCSWSGWAAICGPKKMVCLSDSSYNLCLTPGKEGGLIGKPVACKAEEVCDEQTGPFPCVEKPKNLCGTKKILCDTTTSYFICLTPGSEGSTIGKATTCPPGTICDANNGQFPCVEAGTTLDSLSTLLASSTPSTKPFTPSTKPSTPSTKPTTKATPTTTSTTTPKPVTPPAVCIGPGVFPSNTCSQYFECLLVMWWYELVPRTCPAGQAFDSLSKTCVVNAACVAQ